MLRDKHKARVLSILQRHRELQICVKSLHYMIFRESLNDCAEGFAKKTLKSGENNNFKRVFHCNTITKTWKQNVHLQKNV